MYFKVCPKTPEISPAECTPLRNQRLCLFSVNKVNKFGYKLTIPLPLAYNGAPKGTDRTGCMLLVPVL